MSARARMAGTLPEGWEKSLPTFTPADKDAGTRQFSEALTADRIGSHGVPIVPPDEWHECCECH